MEVISYKGVNDELPQAQRYQRLLTLGSWPSFKGWGVTSNSSEITVVKPIQYGGFLRQSAKGFVVFFLGVVGFCLFGLLTVCLKPSRSDEEYVADHDISALRLGSDVKTLSLPTVEKILV